MLVQRIFWVVSFISSVFVRPFVLAEMNHLHRETEGLAHRVNL